MPKVSRPEPKKLPPMDAGGKKKKALQPRKVLYSEPAVELAYGEEAIDEARAKELLGWEEEPAEGKFGSEYLLKDLNDKKIRCNNNVTDGYTNRPIYTSTIATLQQEILNKRWRFNGETIIIGKTGLLLNGQHQLIGFVLAVQEWKANRAKWAELWDEAPTIDKAIAYGVEEDDTTVNTMDTCKPRSLADVIFRSALFQNLKESNRKKAARMADNAIRLIWSRTGAGLSAFAPRRTHAESLAFIERHPRLLDCVMHVMEEEGKSKKLSQFVPPGYASGLLYLMGCSQSDHDTYHTDPTPREELLNWNNWTKACSFITKLAANGKDVQAIRAVLGNLAKEGLLSTQSRCSVVVNAWACFLEDAPITYEEIDLMYGENDNGDRVIAETPTVGGIDIGDPRDADETIIRANDPTPEEIEADKKRTKEKKTAKKAAKVPSTTKRAGDDWAPDDVAWVFESDGEHYMAVIITEPWETDGDGGDMITVRNEDGDWDVRVDDLSLKKPEDVKKSTMPKMKAKGKDKAKDKKTIGEFKAGEQVWVMSPDDEEPWKGKLISLTAKKATLKVATGFQGAGNTQEVAIKYLSREQPIPDAMDDDEDEYEDIEE